MTDVRRVRVFEDKMTVHVSGDDLEMSETYRADRVIDDPNGTHYLLTAEEYEHIRDADEISWRDAEIKMLRDRVSDPDQMVDRLRKMAERHGGLK